MYDSWTGGIHSTPPLPAHESPTIAEHHFRNPAVISSFSVKSVMLDISAQLKRTCSIFANKMLMYLVNVCLKEEKVREDMTF